MSGTQHLVEDDRSELMSRFEAVLQTASTPKLQTLKRFVNDVAGTEPIIRVEAFLTWKDNQVIDTILLLMAGMQLDEQEHIMSSVRELIEENHSH